MCPTTRCGRSEKKSVEDVTSRNVSVAPSLVMPRAVCTNIDCFGLELFNLLLIHGWDLRC